MIAITAALQQLDDIAADGDLVPNPLPSDSLELEALSGPIVLPDGKRIYPPTLHGERGDALALALLDHGRAGALELPASGRPARHREKPPLDRAWDPRLP